MRRRLMHEQIGEFIRNEPGEVTIDELAKRFLATQAITDEFREAALINELKVALRKAINEDRIDGVPRLQSVLRKDPASGEERHVYVQAMLFDVGDFKQQWRRADEAERRCREKKQKLERDFGQAYPEERPLRQQMLGFRKDNGAGGHAA